MATPSPVNINTTTKEQLMTVGSISNQRLLGIIHSQQNQLTNFQVKFAEAEKVTSGLQSQLLASNTKVRSLETKAAEAERQLSLKESKPSYIEDRFHELLSMESEYQTLQSKYVEGERKWMESEFERKLLKSENETFRHQFNKLARENKSLKADLKRGHNHSQVVEQELRTLDQHAKWLEAENVDLEKQVSLLSDSLNQAQLGKCNLQRQVRKLKQELEDAEAKCLATSESLFNCKLKHNQCNNELVDSKSYVQYLLKQSIMDSLVMDQQHSELKVLRSKLEYLNGELSQQSPIRLDIDDFAESSYSDSANWYEEGEQQKHESPQQICNSAGAPVYDTGIDVEQQPIPPVDEFADSMSCNINDNWYAEGEHPPDLNECIIDRDACITMSIQFSDKPAVDSG